MLAPAAFWGGAVPSAAQSAGIEPERAYDAATPSAIESAGLGFMTASHRRGLQSGGMFGYSTFFTGYDPQRGHGTGRMLSLGRLAASGVSVASQGLLQTPLGNYDAAAKVLEPLTMTHKYGVGGAMHAISQGPLDSSSREVFVGGSSSTRIPPSRQLPEPSGPAARARQMEPEFVGPHSRWPGADRSAKAGTVPEPDPYQPTGGAVKKQTVEEATEEAAEEVADNKSWGKWFVGLFGGEGYKKGGTQAAFKEMTEKVGDRTYGFAAAPDGTAGAAIGGGRLGKALGAAFKIGAGYEVARMAVDAGTYVAGEAYESMVETTSTIRRRLGTDESMSPAYYNRAAATERQRARRELNSRSLNPRTQLRGNEAYMAHG